MPVDLNFVTLKAVPASPREFVAYWFDQYRHRLEDLYTNNISKPRDRETVMALFQWKNGGTISAPKTRSIETHYIPRIGEPVPSDAGAFLRSFGSGGGGAVWPIFWLCCDQRFPIYDQHVHRAMTFIEDGVLDDLEKRPDPEKIDLYLKRYQPFCQRFEAIDRRQTDRALWVFGKFIKVSTFPEFRHLHDQ
jgi:hypothetical protein